MFHLKFPWFAGCLKIWLSLSHVTTSLQRAGCQNHLWSCGDLRSPSKQCRDPAFQASGGSALHSLQWGACSMTAAHLHGDRHCFPCLRVCSQKYSIFCLKSSGSTHSYTRTEPKIQSPCASPFAALLPESGTRAVVWELWLCWISV